MFFHNKFLFINNRGNIKTFFTTLIHGFNVISISVNIFEVEKIPYRL